MFPNRKNHSLFKLMAVRCQLACYFAGGEFVYEMGSPQAVLELVTFLSPMSSVRILGEGHYTSPMCYFNPAN